MGLWRAEAGAGRTSQSPLRRKHWWEGKWKQDCPEKGGVVQQGVGGRRGRSGSVHSLVMKGLQQPLLWNPYRLPDIMLEATLLGRNGSRVGAPMIGCLLSWKGWWDGEARAWREPAVTQSDCTGASVGGGPGLLCADKLCLPM